jgi:hypothetical protein
LAALMANDPDAALWIQITRLRTQALRKGQQPPAYYKLVPLEPPASLKRLGRSRRKLEEARARELAAQKQAEQ